MKNCGEDLHAEVFSKSFMEGMKTVIKVSNGYVVARVIHLINTIPLFRPINKILELII